MSNMPKLDSRAARDAVDRTQLYLENAHYALRDGRSLSRKQTQALLQLLDAIAAVGKGYCPVCDHPATKVVFAGYRITWFCLDGCNP